MAYVEALTTYVLAAVGLGSAIFILLGILPALFPNALSALVKQNQELRSRAHGTFNDLDVEAMQKANQEIMEISERIDTLFSDIRGIFNAGVLSAGLFILSAIVGLLALAQPPAYDSTNSAYISIGLAGDGALVLLFGAASVFLLAFLASFYRIAKASLPLTPMVSRSSSPTVLVGSK